MIVAGALVIPSTVAVTCAVPALKAVARPYGVIDSTVCPDNIVQFAEPRVIGITEFVAVLLLDCATKVRSAIAPTFSVCAGTVTVSTAWRISPN